MKKKIHVDRRATRRTTTIDCRPEELDVSWTTTSLLSLSKFFASTTLLARAFKASKSSFHFTSSPTETFKDSIFVVLTSKLNPINVQEDLRVLFIMLAHIRKSPGMTETEGQTSTLICC
ncbi:hypothetical protein HZH66_002410 [Vespula vulgaris]|uniref:Uncharacterized protein n=1 Tax=Vespula vulgaris TaxID=7454 RepID=A0A834KJT4_VESVU|nr:hypothetical protein HZH66_002410 [Vespula vulgaris]